MTRFEDTAPEFLRPEFDFLTLVSDDRNYVTFTDEHPAASYGIPVMVHDDKVYGPGDVPNFKIRHVPDRMPPETADWLRAGGWDVEIIEGEPR